VVTEVSQEYTYAYATVSVPEGAMDSLILPHVNGACMQIFLDEVASRYPEDRLVMVMNGAGWHRNQDLVVPENMRLLPLPPYSPELNPVEHLWDELREKWFHNRVFDSLEALEDHLETGLRSMEGSPEIVHSIVSWPWITDSLLI
jgi:hypothetical protein